MAKSKKQASVAKPTAVALEASKVKTLDTYTDKLSRFCSSVLPAHAVAVKEAVAFISAAQQRMVENVMAIGERLNTLRTEIGADEFATFVKNVLPAMGISRSAGYRWMGISTNLRTTFPNPAVRAAIVAHTDGRGIIAADETGKLELTPAFQTAIKKVGAVPTGSLNTEEAEQYTLRLISEANKARNEARHTTKAEARAKAYKRIEDAFSLYAEKYGIKFANELLNDLGEFLTTQAKTIAAEQAPAAKKQAA